MKYTAGMAKGKLETQKRKRSHFLERLELQVSRLLKILRH